MIKSKIKGDRQRKPLFQVNNYALPINQTREMIKQDRDLKKIIAEMTVFNNLSPPTYSLQVPAYPFTLGSPDGTT